MADDTNGHQDVFVRDLDVGVTRRVMAFVANRPRSPTQFQTAVFNWIQPEEVAERRRWTWTVVDWTRIRDGRMTTGKRAFGSIHGGTIPTGTVRLLEEIIVGTLPNPPASPLRLRLRADESGPIHPNGTASLPLRASCEPGGLDQPPQVIRTWRHGRTLIHEQLRPLDETTTPYGVCASRNVPSLNVPEDPRREGHSPPPGLNA